MTTDAPFPDAEVVTARRTAAELNAEINERLDALSRKYLGEPFSRPIESTDGNAPAVDADPMAAASDAITTMRQRVQTLRAERTRHEAEMRADSRWSDEYRKEQIAGIQQAHAAEAEAVAATAWRRMELAEGVVAERLRDAERAVDANVNPVAVRALAEDYRSRLDLEADASGGLNSTENRLAIIARWMDQAEASGDPVRLRAVRVAAAPYITKARASSSGDVGRAASDLQRRARGLLATERAEADGLAGTLATVRARRAELRSEIEAAEVVMTGQRQTMFQPVTPWQRRVFGEQVEDYGGGVRDKGAR